MELSNEVLKSKGLSLCDAVPDLHNSAKICKNCFKLYDSLSKKYSKLKERLVVLARRACDQSEHGLSATATTAAIAPVTTVTPSMKRNIDESQWGALQTGPILKRRTSEDTGSHLLWLVISYCR